LSGTNDSWQVDETYIKVKGVWKYLYQAVDSAGNTLDFMLSAKRDGTAATHFFRKVLKAKHAQKSERLHKNFILTWQKKWMVFQGEQEGDRHS